MIYQPTPVWPAPGDELKRPSVRILPNGNARPVITISGCKGHAPCGNDVIYREVGMSPRDARVDNDMLVLEIVVGQDELEMGTR